MMSDLIERLRRYQHDITRGLEPKAEYVYELTGKAADEIERLSAEVRHLRERRNSAHKRYMRLRAALESLRMSAQGQDDGWIIDAVDEALKDECRHGETGDCYACAASDQASEALKDDS